MTSRAQCFRPLPGAIAKSEQLMFCTNTFSSRPPATKPCTPQTNPNRELADRLSSRPSATKPCTPQTNPNRDRRRRPGKGFVFKERRGVAPNLIEGQPTCSADGQLCARSAPAVPFRIGGGLGEANQPKKEQMTDPDPIPSNPPARATQHQWPASKSLTTKLLPTILTIEAKIGMKWPAHTC